MRLVAAWSSAANGGRGPPTGKPTAAMPALTAGMKGSFMIAPMSG